MNRNDYWEVIYFDKRPKRFPDMGKKMICDSELEANLFRSYADLDRVDVLVKHLVNGEQVYSRYYE